MQKLEFVDPLENESKFDITMHNLREADKHCELELFIVSSFAWFELNPKTDFSDFEKMLRENNFDAHLYAKNVSNDVYLQYPNKLSLDNSRTPCKYECIYSCRPREYAIKEVLEHWNTLEENFAALKLAGARCIKSSNNDLTENDFTKRNDPVATSRKKVKFVSVTPDQILLELETFCKEKYKKEPEYKVIAMSPNGEPICGAFIDNKLIANTGIQMLSTIGADGTITKTLRIVDLSKIN